MSNADHGNQNQGILRKLRKIRGLLDDADASLRRAEAAARPTPCWSRSPN